MAINYSPSGTFPTWPIVLPQDGETINEAVLVVGILEPLIDAVGENAARTFTALQRFDDGLAMGTAPTEDFDTMADAATNTIDVSKPVWIGPVLGQDCTVTVSDTSAPVPSEGDVISVRADLSASGFNYAVRRETGAVLVVTLITSATDTPWADLQLRGGFWKLLRYGGGAVPGAGA